MGACLKVCDLTPDDDPDLQAAACGAMFNAASQHDTASRLADEPVLMSFAMSCIGVNLDLTVVDFLPRQRLQDYAVGLLSSVATVSTNIPRLVRHSATLSPNGLQDLANALHRQLCHAAACLTETADERWEFTQSTEQVRSGCYAAAVLSKITSHPDFREATVMKKNLSADKDGDQTQEGMRQVAGGFESAKNVEVRPLAADCVLQWL